MSISELIGAMRETFGPLGTPATDSDLERLQDALGPLPEGVLALYCDHDGWQCPRSANGRFLPARLFPVAEAIDVNRELSQVFSAAPAPGSITWLWTDDNSNYVGVCTDGDLRGWLVKLNHDEPQLTPAYRSVTSFLHLLIESVVGAASEDDAPCDVVLIPRELPAKSDDPRYVEGDRQLADLFRRRFAAERDAEMRRLFGMSAICLTPVVDTALVLPMLAENDMWVPEAAVRLLEMRKFRGGIYELERLAREGLHNGAAAAMRHLVKLGTPDAREAVARMEQSLTGEKLKQLRWTVEFRHRFLPPSRWD